MAKDRSNGVDDFDLKMAARPGIAALRSLWAPILFLQALAVVLVLTYYRSEAVSDVARSIQLLKSRGGMPFVIGSGFVAGGILPTMAKLLTRKARVGDARIWNDLLFNGFVYAIVAIEVDALYRGQAWLFGNGIDWVTLVKKNLVDMGLFSPFLSMPTAVGLFEWRKSAYSISALREELSFRFFRQEIVTALLPCWSFWIPMLFCVYALPQDLQFPFAMIGEASWCLLFVFVATQTES